MEETERVTHVDGSSSILKRLTQRGKCTMALSQGKSLPSQQELLDTNYLLLSFPFHLIYPSMLMHFCFNQNRIFMVSIWLRMFKSEAIVTSDASKFAS